MKPDIHPNYREVVFQDASTGHNFLIHSSVMIAKIKSEEL